MLTMQLTDHEADEFVRMAQDAYNTGRNEFGHRFSVAAACYRMKPMPLAAFDTLKLQYRRWLVGGWAEVEHPQ